jgi:site-specific recombinase XerC
MQAYDLRQLAHFLKGRFPIGWHWHEIRPTDIRAFVSELRLERSFKHHTIEQKLSHVRSFFSYLESIGAIKENPTADISVPDRNGHDRAS